jgi:hypothetical protein
MAWDFPHTKPNHEKTKKKKKKAMNLSVSIFSSDALEVVVEDAILHAAGQANKLYHHHHHHEKKRYYMIPCSVIPFRKICFKPPSFQQFKEMFISNI